MTHLMTLAQVKHSSDIDNDAVQCIILLKPDWPER